MIETLFKAPKTRFAIVLQLSAVALIAFTLMRIILLVRAWPYIDGISHEWFYIFSRGLIYDIAFLGYFSIPFVLFLLFIPNQWLQSRLFRIVNDSASFGILYGLGINLVAEWYFWSEFGVRFNFISVDYLVYRREVTDNILQSYPVFIILPVLLIATGLVFYFIRPMLEKPLDVAESFKKRLSITVLLMMVPAVSFIALDQSGHSLSDKNYVNELASNGPYQLFAAFRNNRLDFKRFYATGNDVELSKTLKSQIRDDLTSHPNGIYNISRYVNAQAPPKKLNVILITVESLSAKFLTRFGQKENLTPFMDDWFKKGMLFTRFYATGTRTTRGLEAITLSIPPTPGRSIVKRPNNQKMFSLGKVFEDMGYDTAFLYGGRGFFDNMNAFFSGNGYRIVDQPRLKSDEVTFKNAWGVCDEDIFRRAVKEADTDSNADRPFFFHIMTTSNHQPFTFPKGKINLTPGEGKNGSGRFGGVKYTDYALSQFVKLAKRQPWFENTVFVVVADHCAASAGKIGLPVKKYHIPLFIFSPKYINPGEIDALSSQIDLAPTLLAMLNFSYESFFFGKNILSPDFKERALIANYQKLGLLKKHELLFLSPGKIINRLDIDAAHPGLEKVGSGYPGVEELISYYQGADYVFSHGLNRWDEITNKIAKSKSKRHRTDI